MSYPAATGLAAVENAVQLADNVGARLSAMTYEMEVAPFIGLFVEVQHVSAVIDAEREKNHKLAREVVATFERVANLAGLPHDHIVAHCAPGEFPGRLVKEAHLRDLSMLAIGGKGMEQSLAEALVFESGRPVLIFPEEPQRELAGAMDNVALAWDSSGPATRAMTDAFPLLERSRTLRIFTVVDEKPIDASSSSEALPEHLARHGIKAVCDEVRSHGKPIGEVFTSYVAEHKIDLLVMGAYGHSRFREFVLGGATRSIMASPPTWVLLSH
ncbi:MAG: universal stress protein [Hyphomicrobiales bacterium]